ncbi:hypothetical protein ACI8AC_19545 [Geodermatophilus sp. SYSU D00758]
MLALVGALGIAGAVGGILVQSAFEAAQDRLLDPVVVQVEDRTGTPNHLFPVTVDPAGAPVDIDTVDTAEFERWATENGGIPYGDRSLELVLRGREAEPVVIDEIRVRVLETSPVPDGTWVNSWEGCGAAVPVRVLVVDLAGDPPSVEVYVDGVLEDSPVFRVSDSDVEVFHVEVVGGPGVVSWALEMSYSAAGEDGTVTVDEVDGRPLRLAHGGTPLVYSVAPGARGLVRADEVRDALLRGEPLC